MSFEHRKRLHCWWFKITHYLCSANKPNFTAKPRVFAQVPKRDKQAMRVPVENISPNCSHSPSGPSQDGRPMNPERRRGKR